MSEQAIFRSDDPALPGHFPGHPIVPGVLLLDAVIAQCREGIAHGRTVSGMERVKFLRPLAPDEPFAIDARLSSEDTIEFACTAGGQTIASGRLRLRVP